VDGSPPSLIRTVVSPPRYCAGYAPPSPPAVKWLFASVAVKNAVKAHVNAPQAVAEATGVARVKASGS